MTILSTDVARQHLRIDSDDTAPNLPTYIAAAEGMVEKYINRHMYPDATTMQTAQATANDALADARTAYLAVIDNLSGFDSGERGAMYSASHAAWVEARWEYVATMRGVVTDETLQAATLLILGHLYTNREDVVQGTGLTALPLPQGSQWLLEPYRAYLGVYDHPCDPIADFAVQEWGSST